MNVFVSISTFVRIGKLVKFLSFIGRIGLIGKLVNYFNWFCMYACISSQFVCGTSTYRPPYSDAGGLSK